MDRKLKTGLTAPRLALAATTAIAALALPGCMTSAAPPAQVSFDKAHGALAKGQVDKAIAHAEAAVLADPRNPGFRALLGAAYLEAGRFQSAATSFGDALDLGDDNPRTVLSFALARIALGEGRAAASVLDEYADSIDPADLGLALALAGQPERGAGVLVNAVRASDEASPKLRQNLAYTYALAGNWKMARVMAAEDVPADQLDARLGEWATAAAPEMFQQRIAALLDVTPRADAGQPQRLALANFPAQEVMVAEAAAQGDVSADEEPVQVAAAESSPAFTQAFAPAEPAIATVEPASSQGLRYVSNPVVQQLGVRGTGAPRVAGAVPQRRMAATAAAVQAPVAKPEGTHLVQLGAYSSKLEAERGWVVLKAKFPQLGDRSPVITQAVVNGRTFWRVAADGFGRQSARAMCGTVKSAGRGCFAYAASSPPKGAVASEVRVAARTR
ncbi:tetratricopeptide repeat protein [Erythrobacter sp. NE805]|uniref:tetratricopeptide repeat protein n=1 Tax=Erythrobacter sp. NE805 TaxID=3389875 RepID=UPI00396B0256